MINGGVNHRARESKLQLTGRADCIDSYDGNVSRIVRRYFLWRPPLPNVCPLGGHYWRLPTISDKTERWCGFRVLLRLETHGYTQDYLLITIVES